MTINSISPALMKVLVVDDVEDNVELIEQILEDDCTIISAYSGAECIEKALSEEPGLILLDVNMPTMDGYETMLKLQQNIKTQDIPVIFASAYYKEAAMIVKGLELGAFDYLTKPIDEDILLAKVRVVKRIKFAEEMLSRSQKMDALGKLTGGIAHDYNNMLGVVLGYTSLLEDNEIIIKHPKLLGFTKQIKRAGERGAKLTKKLLSFSRKDSSQEEIANINTLLRDEQLMLEKTLTSRIKLIFKFTDNLWPVYIESSEMVDVILNMSINAMHAMEDNGGTLTFKTSNVKINKTDSLWLQKDAGDYVLLNITDSGCGITEEMKEKIFDPFFSTKGEKGTGLGLSQVYGFVERSGGAIDVYSELGIGTSFSLYFPRHNANNSNELPIEENINNIDLKGKERILIVDDEPGLLSFITEVISQQGYNTLSAESAEQALKILETESVDLLLSDVIMHGMDGYQLANIVQKKYPNIKIQLASGFTNDLHLNTIDEKLHKHILHKPFDSELLLKRIRYLLNNYEIDSTESISSSNKQVKHFIWTQENNIGIDQMDQDHRILVSLVNNAITIANSPDTDNKEISSVLAGLIDYAEYHFQREELLMNICEYPYTEKHQTEHQSLLKLMEMRLEDYESEKIDTNTLLTFLINWLNSHINEMDKTIEPYCKGKSDDFERALKSS